jgi:Ca2+-binding EF-hand superfamily protein
MGLPEEEEEEDPHDNIDRFDHGGDASSHKVECFCDPLPESVLKYMKGALPMGVDADGNECVCYPDDPYQPEPEEVAVEETIDIVEEEEVPEEAIVCIAEPEFETVDYDFCTMERSFFRAMFHLSDKNSDGQVTYDDMLTNLESMLDVPTNGMAKSLFAELDADGCGYATWKEIRDHSQSQGFSEKASDA